MLSKFLLFCILSVAIAEVKYLDHEFHWPERPAIIDKTVGARIYYPSDVSGPLPVIVLTHCLWGARSWYQYIADAIVPKGYIIIMDGTFEYSFGKLIWQPKLLANDMLFLLDAVYEMSRTDKTVPFFGLLGDDVNAIAAGHSIGAMASIVASQHATTPFKGVFAMAPCDLFLSPKLVNVPTFIMSGSRDCICPNAGTQTVYDHLSSSCKMHVEITNATHCHFDQVASFMDDGCAAVEDVMPFCKDLFKGENLPIVEQERLVTKYMLPWVEYVLKGEVSALSSIKDFSLHDSLGGLLAVEDGC